MSSFFNSSSNPIWISVVSLPEHMSKSSFTSQVSVAANNKKSCHLQTVLILTKSLKAKATATDYLLLFDFYLHLFIGLIHFEWDYKIADDVFDCKEFLLRTKLL